MGSKEIFWARSWWFNLTINVRLTWQNCDDEEQCMLSLTFLPNVDMFVGDMSLGNLFFGGRGTWKTGLGVFGMSMFYGRCLWGSWYLLSPADGGLMRGSNVASPWASAMSLSCCLLNMPDCDSGLAGVGEWCLWMAFWHLRDGLRSSSELGSPESLQGVVRHGMQL